MLEINYKTTRDYDDLLIVFSDNESHNKNSSRERKSVD